VYDGCAWEVTGTKLLLLSSCFRSGVGGVKYCWNRKSSNFGFRNKFIIILPFGLLHSQCITAYQHSRLRLYQYLYSHKIPHTLNIHVDAECIMDII